MNQRKIQLGDAIQKQVCKTLQTHSKHGQSVHLGPGKTKQKKKHVESLHFSQYGKLLIILMAYS